MNVSFEDTGTAYAFKTNAELKNANFIFSMINNPTLCAIATTLVKWCFKFRVPIDWIIKRTVFSHFCGGSNIAASQRVVDRLGTSGVETILDYSVEGEDTEQVFDQTMNEILLTIENAACTRHIAFAVFKVTGIASAQLLERVQNGAQLSLDENTAVTRYETRIDTICRKAYTNKIRLLIDAEETWIQGAIDAIVTKMMSRYNKEQSIVFTTYQLYRTDALDNMKSASHTAKENGYHFGVKLVRGAYMEKERERAQERGYTSPIHRDQQSCNTAFNTAVAYCIDNIRHISLMCGSHNEYSNRLLTALMSEKGLKRNDPRIWFSQLYGMSDHISFNLAKAGYNVAKYVPYGPVRSVMPYLLRRASENTSVAGQSSRELTMVRTELKRRNTSSNM